MTDTATNGRIHHLAHGDFTADITEVGAAQRSLTHRGRDLTLPFDPDDVRPVAIGAILAPWPNRITGGRYTHRGVDHRLPLTEPSSSTAIHGLAMWVRWDAVESTVDRVVLEHYLVPQPGYPFPLRLIAEYRLDDDGLHATVTATNAGHDPAPYGFGSHPYLIAEPGGTVDDWTVEFDAASYLHFATPPVADESMRSVGGDPADFRDRTLVGRTRLNHPYTDLATDDTGRAALTVTAPSGRGTRITWNAEACPWAQLFTTDFEGRDYYRRALAVEPMSCPPNAFNNGIDLITLEPGGSHTATWSISAVA